MIRPGIRRLFRLPVRSAALAEQDLDEEIRLHLELRVEQLERQGLTPEAARAEAWRRFGPEEEARRALRRAARRKEERMRLRDRMDSVRQDLRHGARQLARSPGFAAVVVATLALGIGTSVAVYSAGRALVADAVPFPGPDRLLSVELSGPRGEGLNPAYGDLRVWREEAGGVVDLAGFTFGPRIVGDGARSTHAWSLRVTERFFPVLGARPLFGRTLLPDDASPGSAPVAVVSLRLWRELLGSDPDAVGRPLLVGGRAHTLVGVLAADQAFPAPVDVWVPLDAAGEDAASMYLSVIGRLEPGTTAEEARVALETIQRGLDAERPADERASRVTIQPLPGELAEYYRSALLLLLCAVLFLLLIGAANAAGLMTTRAVERRQEIAIRASLGAGRARIARQLLVESTLLALAAGALGVGVACAMVRALRFGLPEEVTRQILGWERLALDGEALLFALAVSAATGIVFGLVPAVGAVRGDLTASLRDGAPTATADRGRSRSVRVLLVGEVALALALLLSAGLLTRSLLELMGSDPGFRAEGVLAVEWGLPRDRYEGEAPVERFQDPLLERLRALPGVRSVGVASNLPTTLAGFGQRREYRVEGAAPAAEPARAAWRPISPGYLETLGIPLLRGRHFASGDDAGAAPVAIVSEALARRHWPDGTDPLGHGLRIEDGVWTVVGVARDVHHFGVGSGPPATIYVPQSQSPTTSGFLVARVAGDREAVAPLLRREIWGIDPGIAAGEVRTMEGVIDDFLADQRVMAYLLAIYASMALAITVISLYALVAHSVARRRREIGIRLALGARPRRILAGAMGQGLVWVGLGIGAGLLLAAGGARLMAGMLYGIGPLDPLVYAVVSGGTLAVAALASYLPARRAARVDPVVTLRAE